MSPNLKILIVIGFSVGTNLLLMLLLSKLPGMHIPHGWWLAGVAIPVLISSPVAFVLVRQSESIRLLNAELTSAYQAVKRVSETDHLTGVPNRVSFDIRVASQQVRRPGWFLVVDIDHFKDINDRHGHALGDAALRIVAEGLVAAVGPDDIVGRIGGEEFAIFLPVASGQTALSLAENIRKAVAALVIIGPDGARIAMTASIGVSGGPGHTVATGLIAADRAMYRAKQEGRDRVQLDV